MLPGEPITRLRGNLIVDPYSGESTQLDWATPTEAILQDCIIGSGGSFEPLRDARNSVESDFDVVVQHVNVDVKPTDRLVIPRSGGLVCEVVGRPFEWRLGSWEPGTFLSVKIVEG